MNRFTADYSSSLGSSVADTPPRPTKDLFGEPASTTPLAPPPSQPFGSSRLGTGGTKPLFQKSSPTSTRRAPLFQSQNIQSRQNGTSAKPKSRLFQTSFNSSIGSAYPQDAHDGFPADDIFNEEIDDQPSFASRGNVTSLMKFSANSPRRSMARSTRKHTERHLSQLSRQGQPDFVPGLARDLGARAKKTVVDRDDELILDTEVELQQLYDETHVSMLEEAPEAIIDSKVHQLLMLWQRNIDTSQDPENEASIGPPASASAVERAHYIASLLLTLRQPQHGGRPIATPKAILDWLEDHHVSYEAVYQAVASDTTNVTASELFWDAVLGLTLRGKIQNVMRLLAEADFKYAATSVDDGSEEPGYRGSQLQAVQSAIYRTRQILNACPASSGNWDTTSEEWELYRGVVQTELDRLEQQSGRAPDEDEDDSARVHRPRMDPMGRQSQSSRNLPWTIYQAVSTMLCILLGSSAEIMSQSQDWLEASCALTVWWDGSSSDQNIARWSADVSRASRRSPSDDDSSDPYLARLRDAFLCVTDPQSKDSFPINAMSPAEVGVGCALQGSVQGVVTILKTLSLCLTSAIAEVGSTAGWLNEVLPPPTGLNSKDLMVLSYGAGREQISKDEVLQDYAVSLFGRDDLRSPTGESIEGWEMSLGILRRMDDTELMDECITDLLNQLDVTEQWRAEKVINLCTDLNLPEAARRISERFGDHLVNNTTSYGLALLCYAKSHSSRKIQQLTDLLVSYCLVQSRAYPSDEEMDAGLHSLIDTPKAAFADIAEVDPEAAAHLQFYMVGYACIRRFYSLRDENTGSSKLGLPARKRAAAKALIAAINSAADCIYGGLYDASRQSAIQVDGLLTLLGEATALLSQSNDSATYTSSQLYALLAAIEDLETVSERVYAAADECLQASMRNYEGSAPPSPREMLKKSMSSGTNSNFSFSLMGSEMLARSGESGGSGGKSVGSAVLVKGSGGKEDGVARGWDWRSAFKGNEVEGVGREVLRELRRGIAGELSWRELEES